jgi:hypothetical protein
MKSCFFAVWLLFFSSFAFGQPFQQLVGDAPVAPVKSGQVQCPFMSWGGDMPFLCCSGTPGNPNYSTQPGSEYDKLGISVKFYHEDEFPLQVKDYLTGKTPFPGGPSDTLARVVISHFHLNHLSKTPFETVNDARDVFENYRKSQPDAKQVYVLWEPWVSKILDNPNTHVLVDSSKFQGYIMDVIVVNRDFLYKNKDTVKAIIESYFRVLYQYRDNMPNLLVEDGKKTDSPLNDKEAANIAKIPPTTLPKWGLQTKEIFNISKMLWGTSQMFW